jgi:hypothetical protein
MPLMVRNRRPVAAGAAAAARLAHGDQRVERLPRWHFAATEDPKSCICCCTHDWKGLMPARFICIELAACMMCGLLLRREPVLGTHSKQKTCICKQRLCCSRYVMPGKNNCWL